MQQLVGQHYTSNQCNPRADITTGLWSANLLINPTGVVAACSMICLSTPQELLLLALWFTSIPHELLLLALWSAYQSHVSYFCLLWFTYQSHKGYCCLLWFYYQSHRGYCCLVYDSLINPTGAIAACSDSIINPTGAIAACWLYYQSYRSYCCLLWFYYQSYRSYCCLLWFYYQSHRSYCCLLWFAYQYHRSYCCLVYDSLINSTGATACYIICLSSPLGLFAACSLICNRLTFTWGSSLMSTEHAGIAVAPSRSVAFRPATPFFRSGIPLLKRSWWPPTFSAPFWNNKHPSNLSSTDINNTLERSIYFCWTHIHSK